MKKRLLTADERQRMSFLYFSRNYTITQLLEHFHCSWAVLHRAFVVSGVTVKPPSAKTNSYKKGNVSWNKDKKGIHLSPQSEFKVGHIPANTKPVGTIRVGWNKGRQVRMIKVAEPKKWMPFSRYLWTQEYGEIIKGDRVVHINRNFMDDTMNNLVALPGGAYLKFTKFGGNLTKEQVRFYRRRYLE